MLTANANANRGLSGAQHWRSSTILENIVMIQAYDSVSSKWNPFGTGVFIDYDTSSASIYLVTNRHIWTSRDSFRLELNHYQMMDSVPSFMPALAIISKKKVRSWCPENADSDFAIVELPRATGQFKLNAITQRNIVHFDDLEYGEPVEFYGFPAYLDYGLFKPTYHLPVSRSGSVSYFAQEDIYFGEKRFLIPGMLLIDGVSIGGNSGGPVFTRRAFVSTTEDGKLTVAYDKRLIGIISKHYPIWHSTDLPLSKFPMTLRILDSLRNLGDTTFARFALPDLSFDYEENSDLAAVISIDIILGYLKTCLAK